MNAGVNKKTKGMANENDKIIGQNLKQIRLRKGLSQGELAKRTEITFQQIQKYEKGTNRISASRLLDLSKVLGVDINIFYSGLVDSENKGVIEEIDPQVLALAKKLLEIEDQSLVRALKSMIKHASNLKH